MFFFVPLEMDELAARVFFLHACSLRTRIELLEEEAENKSRRVINFIGVWESLDSQSPMQSMARSSCFTELRDLRKLQKRIAEAKRVENFLLALFFQLPRGLRLNAQG